MFNAKEFGAAGEDIAAKFLEEKGFSILDRNYRLGRLGEIDIIARNGELVAFVEVKRRSTAAYGGPLYSISSSKKRRLRRIAEGYLAAHPGLGSGGVIFRFDLLSIENGSIQWVQDILR